MAQHEHYDRHIFKPGVAHVASEDCWCEPTRAYWLPDGNGTLLHVLEHNDDAAPASDWVNTVLYGIGKG